LGDARVYAGVEVDEASRPREPVAVALQPVGVPVDFLDLDIEDVAHIGRTQPLGLPINVVHPLKDAFVGGTAPVHRIVGVTALHLQHKRQGTLKGGH
jgi:hypothetical protein